MEKIVLWLKSLTIVELIGVISGIIAIIGAIIWIANRFSKIHNSFKWSFNKFKQFFSKIRNFIYVIGKWFKIIFTITKLEARVTKLEPSKKTAELKEEIPNIPDPPDTFRDPRDKKLYNTVQIGRQVWMAENFAYKGKDGKVGRCYNDDPEIEKIYGRLYTLDEAMKNAPIGWHLPTNGEWFNLINSIRAINHTLTKEQAVYKLKAKEYWNIGEGGTDDFGFSALPGGYFSTGENKFCFIGSRAAWWVSSNPEHEKANVKFIENNGNDCYIDDYKDYKINMFSVRYIKDK